MGHSPPPKKTKTSDNIDTELTDLEDETMMEFQYMKSTESNSLAVADSPYSNLLCDFCMTPYAAACTANINAKVLALRAADPDVDAADRTADAADVTAAAAEAAALKAFAAAYDDDYDTDDYADDDNYPIGGYSTVTNANKYEYLKDGARLLLKFYNDTKLKNFKLVKLCKYNTGGTFCGLTFRAQEDGSEECPLFRGAIYAAGLVMPVFCEIKGDEEVTLLPTDDDYVSPDRSRGSEDSSTFTCKKDLGGGSIAGSHVSEKSSK